MAGFTIYEADNLYDMFDLDFDDICRSALEEAAPVLQSAMKATATSNIKHEGFSSMVKSISINIKKCPKTDCWIVNVGPRGYSKDKVYRPQNGRGGHYERRYPVSNALKAIWMEYGVHGAGQYWIPPKPFIAKAVNKVEFRVHNIIEEFFNERIKDYEL